MSDKPLISVIVPVFNGERFLREAVGNISAQNYRPLEIIVVDDGSTDKTREIAQGLSVPVRYVYQANQGPAAARNTGLAMALGSMIGFLDVDDLWPACRLDCMLARMEGDPSPEIVMGYTKFVRLAGGERVVENLTGRYFIPYLQSAIFKRTVFEKVGFFDPALRFSEDWDWFIRAREQKISVAILDMVSVIARRHGENMTREKNWGDVGIIKVLKKSLDRRRERNHGVVDPLPDSFDFVGRNGDG